MKKIEKNSDRTAQKYVNILGINVISTSIPWVLARLRDKISHNRKFYIVTPNPEHVLASNKNSLLKTALNSSEFTVPDGVGLNYASKFLYGKSINIIPGRKLFEKLVELANKKGWKVFFLGGEGKEATLASEKLKINYKKIKIETFAGPKMGQDGTPRTAFDKTVEKEAIERINKFKPHLLFVAFGNPKQEIWLHKNLKSLNVGGAMVVGGTFRYIAGMSKLPPRWMEKAGLEWIWRLITEPKRFRRILNAFPIFPLKVLLYKLRS